MSVHAVRVLIAMSRKGVKCTGSAGMRIVQICRDVHFPDRLGVEQVRVRFDVWCVSEQNWTCHRMIMFAMTLSATPVLFSPLSFRLFFVIFSCHFCGSQVSTTAPASFQLVAGDAFTCANPGTGNVTGVLAIEATGGSGVWGTTVVPFVTMPEGAYSLKLCIWGGLGTDIDKITFDLVGGLAFLLESVCVHRLCRECLLNFFKSVRVVRVWLVA